MKQNIRLAITGSSGYLAQALIEECVYDPRFDFILGLDIRRPNTAPGYTFMIWDVRKSSLAKIFKAYKINTVLHLAWIFNPHHDERLVYEVDVLGTHNVLQACVEAGVKRIIYPGSTTAYGPWPDNPGDPRQVSEWYPRRGHPRYQYSKYKAVVDAMCLQFMAHYRNIEFVLMRGAIVMGPHTDNIVTYVTKLPAMFRILGYDPPMQFFGEEDMRELLYQAIVADSIHGVYNVAADDTLRYSEICRLVGKPTLSLPSWMLYPATELLWKLRLLRFPASLLDFIRFPWVASNEKLKQEFNFTPRQSSREALLSYLRKFRRV